MDLPSPEDSLRVILASPESVEALTIHAESLRRLGLEQAALAAFQKARKAKPPGTVHVLASCIDLQTRRGGGEVDQAWALYTNHLEAACVSVAEAWPVVVVGGRFLERGQHARALRCFERARKLAPPDDPRVWRAAWNATLFSGNALSGLKRWAEAETAFRAVLGMTLPPGAATPAAQAAADGVHVDAWAGLAEARRMQGGLEEALRCYDALAELRIRGAQAGRAEPVPAHVFNRAQCLESLGRLDEAVALLRTVAPGGPSSGPTSTQGGAKEGALHRRCSVLLLCKLLFIRPPEAEADRRALEKRLRRAGELAAEIQTWSQAVRLALRSEAGTHYAYAFFLHHLLRLSALPPPQRSLSASAPWLHLVGDSHCLSFAWRTLTWRGQKRQVCPHLVTGLKAWHLREGKDAAFLTKAVFDRTMAELLTALAAQTEVVDVLVMAGEIDCREGLLPAVKKGYHKTLSAAVAATVRAYVQALARWVSRAADEHEHDGLRLRLRLHVLPVPPPTPLPWSPSPSSVYTDADIVERAGAVAAFNRALGEEIGARGDDGGGIFFLDYTPALTQPAGGEGPCPYPLHLQRSFVADGIHCNASVVEALECYVAKRDK